MTDNLYTSAQDKIIEGIRKASEAIGITMGTSGSNSIIEAIEMPGYLCTNDGLTILASMRFADPLEELGRKILYEAVSRANKVNGDGSSTTAVLTYAIIKEAQKYLKELSPMELKRSLEACIPLIEESIAKQKREITIDTVGAVATISAEDETIGNRIQEIYKQIGKEGIIHWDVSKTGEDYYTIGQGITVHGASYASPYMCDMDEKTGGFLNVARWTKPKVLITKQKIASPDDLNPITFAIYQEGSRELVIFCEEIDASVIGGLIKTRMEKGFKTMVVKMPVLWKDEWYADLALSTGATIIDPNVGLKLKDANLSHLGTIGNIVVSKEDTFIDGIKDLGEHISKLQEGTDEEKVRASRLNTKTARYFVGAGSESALSYRRLKVEDAISASWQALRGGVVAGGGVCLRNIAHELVLDTVGANILLAALRSPFEQIVKNSGIELKPENYRNDNIGFDTRTRKEVDMFTSNIIDPALIALNAIKNAISVSAIVLTAATVVLLPREEQPMV